MDRRTFLLATPLVFGLRELFAQDAPPKKPAWLDEAFKRMKETARPGLVLVAPAADAERRTFGQEMHDLLESKEPDARELFVEAVVICLAPDVAAKHIDAKGNRIMLDADGKVVASDTVAVDETFVASCREFLHAKDGARLRATVRRVHEGLKDGERAPIESAIDKVDTDGDEPAEALGELKKVADRVAPWLVLARLEAVHKQGRERLRRVLESIAVRALPYGTLLPKFVDICGHWREVQTPDEEGAAFECGMAKAGRGSRKFIKFLTE
jgi:hypothetical protein